MKKRLKRKILLILTVTILLSVLLFMAEHVFVDSEAVVVRNSYGEGKKNLEYEVTVDGELEETLQIEVGEQEYTAKEIQKMFREITNKLSEVVLGENKSFDRVERNLNLVTRLEGYPVQIQWQLDSYSAMNLYGEIQEKNLVEEGTVVELRATLSYQEEESIYIQHAWIYPLTRTGVD